MATYKVHIPGEKLNGVQKCTRCHAKIDTDLASGGWAPGVPVASDGRGSMTVRIPADARDCGRKAAVK